MDADYTFPILYVVGAAAFVGLVWWFFFCKTRD